MILKRKYGIVINRKKIARIKKEYGLITKIRKKNPYNIAFKKDLEHRTANNLLAQNFRVDVPDRVYSTDISYLPYKNSKRAYLSALKDLASKEIVAFKVVRSLEFDKVFDGFEEVLKGKDNLIIHSDQGLHYTHPFYVNMLADNGVTQSMSRKGNCLDNAPIESFFGHMKDEIELKTCQTFEELKEMVENYVYYYNNERYQWGLKQMTPAEYRCHLLKQ
jgi:transposase InsO family protein